MLTFDSNILIYAHDAREPARRAIAQMVLREATGRALLTQQAIGEFCHVAFRKQLLSVGAIRARVDTWSLLFPIYPTDRVQLLAAVDLAERHRKQFWDMVIVRVAADAGATTLLTEDIGDGEVIAGVRIVDPFNPANATLLTAVLG